MKEAKDVITEEVHYIENQAADFQGITIGISIKISHTLLPTVVDGKVCNAATNITSTLRCYICGKTQKTLDDLNVENMENPATFKRSQNTSYRQRRVIPHPVKKNVQEQSDNEV